MRKDNFKPSIMQTKCECYLCHKPYTVGLDKHHAIAGDHKPCDDLGLWVWLCRECHTKLHDQLIGYKEIQADAQRSFIGNELKKGRTEEEARKIWYERFFKFYD